MDLILNHVMAITMNPRRDIYRDCAIVIRDGLFAAIGPSETILAQFPDIRQIRDCRGRVAIPGLINIHTHATLCIIRGMAEDMGTAPAYTKSVPQGQLLSAEESRIMATLGAVEALRFGSTLIADNYTYSDQNAAAFSSLGMRAMVSERVHDIIFYGLPQGIYERDEKMGEALLQKNVDLIEKWNGKDNGRIRCCLGPHAPDTCTPEFLSRIADLSGSLGVGLATHLSQSKGERKNIEALYGTTSTQYLHSCGILRPSLIAAHCIYVTDEDISLLSQNGVTVAHAAEGNAKGGMVAPMMKMKQAGINIGIATDNGAANMIETMRLALCSARMLADSCTSPQPMEILEMATLNGAKALGLEKEIGSIEVGKKADLVLLDYRKPHLTPCINAVGNLLHTAQGSDVETVIIDGCPVVEEGEVRTIDVSSLLHEAQQVASRKWLEVNDTVDSRLML